MNNQEFIVGPEDEDLYLDMMNLPLSWITENTPTMVQESPTGILPPIEDYPGCHNFQMFVQPNETEQNAWTYSSEAEMLFIDIGKTALINFRFENPGNDLQIRAILVYTDSSQRSIPVVRCPRHQHEHDPRGEAHMNNMCSCPSFNKVGHVLQTKREDATYDYDSASQRHSVIVNVGIPPPGSKDITVPYNFACMSSCVGGINRRPLYLIFTLETQSGQVLGRRKLFVKVCKCPKRDRERMEAERSAPPGKRIKKSKVKYELVEIPTETNEAQPCPNCGQQIANLERLIQEQNLIMERKLQEQSLHFERKLQEQSLNFQRQTQELKDLLLAHFQQ